MNTPFSISVLTTIDPVLRGSTAFSLAQDDPHLVTVTHDILDGAIRRVVADANGIIEDSVEPLEHACLSCAVREDVIPTLVRLRARNQWNGALVALPVSAEATPLLRALTHEMLHRGALSGASYGATIAVVDPETFGTDAFDDEWLPDRGVALHEDDERVVAEALAPIVSVADVVALACEGAAPPSSFAAAQHLRGDGATVQHWQLDTLSAASALRPRCRIQDTLDRADPLRISGRSPREDAGVWTLRLESDQPFHPARLRANLHRLADHKVRARGVFWVASRPGSACVWDGAGRQLSMGDAGPWGARTRRTCLLVTGRGAERATILSAFHETLARPDEVQNPAGGAADTLADWFDEDVI